jgi:hypothetical protein
MATYIADQETCDLIQRYAERVHKNKTAALRDLLQRELADDDWAARGEQRLKSAMAIVRRNRKRHSEPIPKKVFDDLYSYLDEEREKYEAADRPRRRKQKSA